MTTSMTLGGIRMPSVPPAQIVPAESPVSYPDFFMTGAAINPMIVTEAPTIPVAAANSVAVKMVAMYREPRRRPEMSCTALKRRSISPALSRTQPMKVKRATAARTVSIIVPKKEKVIR